MIVVVILVGLLMLLTATVSKEVYLYLYKRWIDSYWEKRGIFTYKEHNENEYIVLETYKTLKAKGYKHGAFVRYYRPFFMTTDLDEIKAILIRDADHFINRGMYSNPKADPMSATLARLENEDWKNVRGIVSPIFSSGKMRMVFADIAAHAKTLQEAIAPYAETKIPLDAKDIAKKFGMDSMGSCTFGFDINTLKGQNRDFQELVSYRMKVNSKIIAEYVLNWNLLKFIGFKTSDPKLDHYVQRIISDTCEYRKKNGIERNDIFKFVQEITDNDIDENELVKNNKVSKSQMIRLLQTFFIGGFETSSNLTSFALLELALNQGIQNKLRANIRECLNKHHSFTYDAVREMEYLDWVICESLRKYPPGQSIHRYCNKTYKIPNTNILIYPGEFISIPTLGIHNDPDYYSEPEQFQPERFSPENKSKRHPMTFLPFGSGPRNCIGARLGQILSKVAVAAIISKFRITVNEKTTTPIIFERKSLLLDVEGGIWLNCSKI